MPIHLLHFAMSFILNKKIGTYCFFTDAPMHIFFLCVQEIYGCIFGEILEGKREELLQKRHRRAKKLASATPAAVEVKILEKGNRCDCILKGTRPPRVQWRVFTAVRFVIVASIKPKAEPLTRPLCIEQPPDRGGRGWLRLVCSGLGGAYLAIKGE